MPTRKTKKADAQSAKSQKATDKGPAKKARTLADVFRRVIGQAKGLPADASTNHDHYLYGAPKRS